MDMVCPACGKSLGTVDSTSSGLSMSRCPSCDAELFGEAALLVGRRVGDYILERHIGSGGMGEVFIAKQISMKRPVAVKILRRNLSSDAKYLERFFREVRLLAQIEHGSVVQAIETGVDGELCFFSMEYVDGKDLKWHIVSGRSFGEEEALKIARDVARALRHAWDRHKLIHRDVKPSNIMVSSQESEIKLMDLGISKLQKESSDLTVDGMMVGSPTYMSPEQALGEPGLDFCADIYSLGATMYHLMAGVAPYEADSPMGVISRHLSDPVPNIREKAPNISKQTASLIMRMMAKKKEDRFDSWGDALAEMDRLLEGFEDRREKELSAATRRAEVKFSNPVMAFLLDRVRWHRLVSLLVVLLFFLMAFGAVVKRSVSDARIRRERMEIESAVAEAASCKAESRPALLRRLENIARSTSSEEYKEKAMSCIGAIKVKAAEERAAAEAEKKSSALESLRQRSFMLEGEDDFDGAIKLWESYAKTGEFKDDPGFGSETEDSISYLKRKKEERDAGFYE